jgi:hypothetical protein
VAGEKIGGVFFIMVLDHRQFLNFSKEVKRTPLFSVTFSMSHCA